MDDHDKIVKGGKKYERLR